MNDEQSPNPSPSPAPAAPAAPRSRDLLVRRGRLIYLGIIIFSLSLEFGLPFLLRREPSPIRGALTVGLLFAGWRGHGWAITLLALCLGLGVLLAVLVVFQALIAGLPLAAVAMLAIALAYAGIGLALIYSESLNGFFKYQEQQRRGEGPVAAATSNRRNVVALTPDAAELARQTIASQEYPPETALRVVLRNDGGTGIGVQYDLPSDDDRDWVGESSGVVVLVEKAIAGRLEGLMIDAQGGRYTFDLPDAAR
jgi:Fe-S cluster assembly iron-binding protein IscA